MRFALLVLAALLALAAFQVVYYAPLLPDTVASHFGPGGEPDGWSSKTELLVVYGVVLLIAVAPFVLLPFLLPRIPDSLFNLPHKDFWLAPERRDETIRTIAVYLLWLANATLLLIIAVMGEAMEANLTAEPRLEDHFWAILGLYLAFVAVWLVIFVRRFRRAPR